MQSSVTDYRVFAPFFAGLENMGLKLGIREYERIQLALNTKAQWTCASIKDVLITLLVKNEDQQRLFEREFDQYFKGTQSNQNIDIEQFRSELVKLTNEETAQQTSSFFPQPEQHTSTIKRSHPINTKRWQLLFLLILFSSLFAYYLVTSLSYIKPNPPAKINTPTPVETSATTEQTPKYLYQQPILRPSTGSSEKQTVEWQLPASIAIIFFILGLVYFYWLRAAQRPLQDTPLIHDSKKSRFFNPASIGAKTKPRLDRDTLDFIADSIGYFQSEQVSSRLDINATVRSTADNGGIPALCFEQRKAVRQVIILQDVQAEAQRWNPVASELSQGLHQRGVPLMMGYYRGNPAVFVDQMGRQRQLEDYDDQRNSYLLLLFSDGKGISKRDRLIFENLSHWPMIAWMEVREPRNWDETTRYIRDYGIPLFYASASGLTDMIRNVGDEPPQVRNPLSNFSEKNRHNLSLSAWLQIHLAEALPWAQACGMVTPPISINLAQSLREAHFAYLPAEVVERLFTLPETGRGGDTLTFSQPVLAELRRGFNNRLSEEKQNAILLYLEAQLKPALVEQTDNQGLAYLIQQWRYQRLRLEREPDIALQALFKLSQNEILAGVIKHELAAVSLTTKNNSDAIPLRTVPKSMTAKRRFLQLNPQGGIKRGDAFPNSRLHGLLISSLLLASFTSSGYIAYLFYDLRFAEKYLTIELNPAKDGATTKIRWQSTNGIRWRGVDQLAISDLKSEKFSLPVRVKEVANISLLHNGQVTTYSKNSLLKNSSLTIDYIATDEGCERVWPSLALTEIQCKPKIDLWYSNIDDTLPPALFKYIQKRDDTSKRFRSNFVGIEIYSSEKVNDNVVRQLFFTEENLRTVFRININNFEPNWKKIADLISNRLYPWNNETDVAIWFLESEDNKNELMSQNKKSKIIQEFKGKFSRVETDRYQKISNVVAMLRAINVASKAPKKSNIFQDPFKNSKQRAPEMIAIPAGEFEMGDINNIGNSNEKPVHKVTVPAFVISRYEITFDDYELFAKATDREVPDDSGWGKGKRPVINVSWNDATAYASWLSEQTGQQYRLPTEAEWEYAARAGTSSPFSTGDCINTSQANYNENYNMEGCKKTGVYLKKTQTVGEYPVNQFGVYDMHGNVWEWVADCYHNNYEGAPVDGSAWLDKKSCSSSFRVMRGGSWNIFPRYLRVAYRDWLIPEARTYNVGFRLARTP